MSNQHNKHNRFNVTRLAGGVMLLLVVVLAACTAAESTAAPPAPINTPTPEAAATPEPEPMAAPSVTVADQDILKDNDAVTIAEVVSNGPGWTINFCLIFRLKFKGGIGIY